MEAIIGGLLMKDMKRTYVIMISIFLTITSCVPLINSSEQTKGIIYVDDDGGADFQKIQDAINYASADDTIYVFDGIYNESLSISKSYLNIIGESKYNTIINGTGNAIFLVNCNNVLINNFTIKNASDGIRLSPSDNGQIINYITILDCIIYNNTNDGIIVDLYRRDSGVDYIKIFNCDIYNNGNCGFRIYCHAEWAHSNQNQIKNSRIYENVNHGIEILNYNQNMGYGVISGCEVFNNSKDAIFLLNIHDYKIENCSLYNNLNGTKASNCGNLKIFNNSYYNNSKKGLDLSYFNYLNLIRNDVYNNIEIGCKLFQLTNFNINDSYFAHNDDGILIDTSSNGAINRCSFITNDWSGIVVDSSYNTKIRNSSVNNNYNGIYLIDDSHDNRVESSFITNNSNYGIYLLLSNSNIIFNNYCNNIHNCNEELSTTGNRWNTTKTSGVNIIGGSYIGGNYWDDYPGRDIDNDGLGDTNIPYNCSGSIIGGDYLPLALNITGVNVSIENCDVAANNTITVPIIIHNVTNLMVANVNLSYDPTVMHVLSFTAGSFDETDANINNVTGWIHLGGYQTVSASLNGDVILAMVTLQAVGVKGASSPMNFTYVLLEDIFGEEIEAFNDNGIFFITLDSYGPTIANIMLSPNVIPEDTDGDATCFGTEFTEIMDIFCDVIDDSDIASVTVDLTSLGGGLTEMINIIGTETWYVATNATEGSAIHNGTGYISLPVYINASDKYGNWNVSIALPTVWKNGDVNGGGSLTLYDCTYMAKNMLGFPGWLIPHKNVADVSGNCAFTLYDATYLAKNILGFEGWDELKATQNDNSIVSIQDCDVSSGETITIPIMIQNAANLMTANVNLSYDPTVVHVLSASDSDFDSMLANINNVTGWIHLGGYQISNGALSGDSILAMVTLQAVGAEGTSTPMNFTYSLLEDAIGSPIPITADHGIFSIKILQEFGDVNQSIQDRGFPIRHAIDGDWGAAQSFMPTLESLTRAEIYLRKFGTSEFNLTVELRENHPQGTLIDTLTFTPIEISESWGWFILDFEDTTITPGTQYFIVCPPPPSGVTTSYGYEWGYAFGNLYEDGAFWFTRDGGGLWRDLPTMYEFCFKTYGY